MPFSSFGGVTEAQIESAGGLVAENNLSDLDDAAEARTNLGLEIGTDVQAQSAELNALANVPGNPGLLRKQDGADYVLRRDKLDGTTAPGVNDDASDGYLVGSTWYDTTADKKYVCLDNTEGAAVWRLDSVIIGTDVQAYDAALASLAGLSLTAEDVLVATGADAYKRLAKGSDGNVLSVVAGAVAWAAAAGGGGIESYSFAVAAAKDGTSEFFEFAEVFGTSDLTFNADGTISLPDGVYHIVAKVHDYIASETNVAAYLYNATAATPGTLISSGAAFIGSVTGTDLNFERVPITIDAIVEASGGSFKIGVKGSTTNVYNVNGRDNTISIIKIA